MALQALVSELRLEISTVEWETDFKTPPVLGGAARSNNSAPAVYKIQAPLGTGFLYTAGAELSKRAAPPSTGGV